MITYVHGDLFEAKPTFIAHGVNCQGIMNSGFAKQLREKFPWAYDSYMEACSQRHALDNLGRIRVCGSHNQFVAHCFTQLSYGREAKRYVSYDAVDDCMRTLNEHMDRWLVTEISMPQIGAGLGGGNSWVIEEIIHQRLQNKNVTVYYL